MKHRKIAIPVRDNNLSMHFGQAQHFIVFETENEKILSKRVYQAPVHAEGVYPEWLKKKNITDIITGGIGQKAIDRIVENGINVFDGVTNKPPEELVEDLLTGNLESLGNFCDH